MFDKDIDEVREFLAGCKDKKKLKELKYRKRTSWPAGGGKNIILKDDVGVELGSPQKGSVSFLLWTEDLKRIRDGIISCAGPDLNKSMGMNLPFGKILLVGVSGFNEENTYERYREMESLRFDVDLKGYMMRGVSQYQREWSRVSIEAVKNGFSFKHLGCELINRLKEKSYVKSVELIFVTSNSEDIEALAEVSKRTSRIINAMNKMLEEMSFDCDVCEYVDVCSEITQLKDIKDSLEESKDRHN